MHKEKDMMAVFYDPTNKIVSISQSWIIEKARAQLFFKFIYRRHKTKQ